jgi:trans-aconitate 2-methyltransferase
VRHDVGVADWDGDRYRRVNSLQQYLADRALQHLDLTGVGRLLDVGCGDGRVTAEIAAQIPGAAVVGIDPSPGMIDLARTIPGIDFWLGDVEEMTFEDDMDAVVSFNALHWVRDQQTALARIATALHRGGWALLVLVCNGPRPSVEQVATERTATEAWKKWFGDFCAPFVHPAPADYRRLAEHVGLETVEERVDDLSWDFGTRAAFAEWCTVGSGAWLDQLPDDLASRFMEDVISQYQVVTGSDHVFRFMQLRTRLRKP